jgi:catechol 2,3-dioxygenase-like lactoylglutathione lyase family enzyme
VDIDTFLSPGEGLLITHFLTVSDIARSRRFYSEVLGAQVVREESPCLLTLANGWNVLNVGGGPTADKPDVTLTTPTDLHTVSSFLNIRVTDIHAVYGNGVREVPSSSRLPRTAEPKYAATCAIPTAI